MLLNRDNKPNSQSQISARPDKVTEISDDYAKKQAEIDHIINYMRTMTDILKHGRKNHDAA